MRNPIIKRVRNKAGEKPGRKTDQEFSRKQSRSPANLPLEGQERSQQENRSEEGSGGGSGNIPKAHQKPGPQPANGRAGNRKRAKSAELGQKTYPGPARQAQDMGNRRFSIQRIWDDIFMGTVLHKPLFSAVIFRYTVR